MKHKAFTEIVAHSTRVPEKTVSMFGRNLKLAGLLTSGARGVNAPEMTVMDLTRMLIALCATDRPSDAVDALNRYRNFRSTDVAHLIIAEKTFDIPAGETLEAFLCGMLELPHIAISMIGLMLFIHQDRPLAQIAVGDEKVPFRADAPSDQNEGDGIQTVRSLGCHALREMSLPFYLEKEDGTAWEEMNAVEGRAAKVAKRVIFGVKDEGNADE